MDKISNSILTVQISEHGAELQSIQKNGKEYLSGTIEEVVKPDMPEPEKPEHKEQLVGDEIPFNKPF